MQQHSVETTGLLSYYSTLDEHVERLLDFIDAPYEAVIVPLRIASHAKSLSCYRNVEQMVSRSGGSIQHGWLVMQNGILIEAEHHAVWVNRQHEFVDITPRGQTMPSVIFIPDDRLPYTGVPIDNIRLNKTSNLVADHLIAVAAMRERIVTNASTRLNEMKVLLTSDQHFAHRRYQDLAKELTYFISAGKTIQDPCFCNTRKAYKDCHGATIPTMIEADEARFPQKMIVFTAGQPGYRYPADQLH